MDVSYISFCCTDTKPEPWLNGLRAAIPRAQDPIERRDKQRRDLPRIMGQRKHPDVMRPDVCDTFHTYQLDWNADRILVGMDGRAYMRFENDKKGDHATWPFGTPEYLILNVAVGGWGGQKGIDPKAFPAAMEVDYVRVYQYE